MVVGRGFSGCHEAGSGSGFQCAAAGDACLVGASAMRRNPVQSAAARYNWWCTDVCAAAAGPAKSVHPNGVQWAPKNRCADRALPRGWRQPFFLALSDSLSAPVQRPPKMTRRPTFLSRRSVQTNRVTLFEPSCILLRFSRKLMLPAQCVLLPKMHIPARRKETESQPRSVSRRVRWAAYFSGFVSRN